ncbi:MAG: alanine racemase [Blastocatellales bacterium]
MQQLSHHRPTWAEVSLSALCQNYQTIKTHLTAETQLMAVVKADAYGHGAVRCAQALSDAGADWFGVALIEEGIELRKTGIIQPIFCLGGIWRGQAQDVIKHNLTTAIYRIDQAEELNARANESGATAAIHLKVDTGMGRLGVPLNEFREFASRLKSLDHIKLEGVFSHLADADNAKTDFTELQIDRFDEAASILQELGIDLRWRHLSASAGLHAYPQTHCNLARAGATLYGLTGDVLSPNFPPLDVQPVMSLHSRIVMLKTLAAGQSLGYSRSFTTKRESRIATIPIGYADGFSRALSNCGRVIVRGSFAPVVGRVSMDLIMLDVTDVAGVELGDEVMLIGEQNGLRISAEDLAEQTGTISYEVVTGISARVPRVYV